jgi:hypothetical protein
LLCWYSNLYSMLSVFILLRLDYTEVSSNGIVTLCTPRDIVGITEGIDLGMLDIEFTMDHWRAEVSKITHVENVGITRCHEDVRNETGEHMPGIKEKNGGNKVENVGGEDRHYDVSESFLLDHPNKHVSRSSRVVYCCFNANNSNPHGSEHHVDHQQSKENKRSDIRPF